MSCEADMSVPGEAMIDGAVGFVPADRAGGMCLGAAGRQMVNRTTAATGDTEVLEAKMNIVLAQGLHDSIEYILQALSGQHHRRVVTGDDPLFAYLAYNKVNSNLGTSRHLRYVDDAKLN